MTRPLPTISVAKQLAKARRAEQAEQGTEISHAQALEAVAHEHGFRDWNAFHAAIAGRTRDGWQPGDRVSGRYLSQPFRATVRSAEEVRPGWYRLVLDLDQAVDVVRFESFSNLRKQIRTVVGPDGRSEERTSDGEPHMRLDP